MPAPNAFWIAGELSIGQLRLESPPFQLNQTNAFTWGKLPGSCWASASLTQAPASPPVRLVAVSPIMIGLVGATPSSSW